jgi:hypothetical protein
MVHVIGSSAMMEKLGVLDKLLLYLFRAPAVEVVVDGEAFICTARLHVIEQLTEGAFLA